MVGIKGQKIKAYILLESLVALAVFSVIITIFLTALTMSREQEQRELKQQEILTVATMAVQTGRHQLTLNGETVVIDKDQQHISIFSQGKELLRVEKK